MPIHFDDVDVVPEVRGLGSALIVPCIMCPGATIAVREGKPFIQFPKSLLTSPPLEHHIRALQSRLGEIGVRTKVFKSLPYHQWFMCMWTSARRKKLQEEAKQYEAVIVLGCDSATETARDAVTSSDCKVIEGMKVTGIINTKLSFLLPGRISFKDSRVVPISPRYPVSADRSILNREGEHKKGGQPSTIRSEC